MTLFETMALLAMLMQLAGYLLAIVLIVLWRRRAPQATRYLLVAIGLLFASFVLNHVVSVLVARFYPPAVMAHVAMSQQLISSVCWLVALALFIAAAYVGRSRPTASRPTASAADEFLPGGQVAPPADTNPFVAPADQG